MLQSYRVLFYIHSCIYTQVVHNYLLQTPPSPPPPIGEYHPQRKLLKLSDFTSEEQLNELSVKQLKQLLTLNRVDYKGCVEKGELLERVIMLWVDTNLHKNDSKLDFVFF